MVFATLFRIQMAMKIPLFIQEDAGYDDFLLVRYATNILNGNWLGPFSSLTLAKGASFSIFLAATSALGIPYALALILTYIGSITLFVYVFKRLISNRYFLSLLYLILLYSPVMFHIENTQKVYRGGLIVAMTIFVLASLIGLYTRRNDSKKKLAFWAILSGIGLSFFWYLKEDCIWILPFVLGAITVTIISYLCNRKQNPKFRSRILIVLLPVIMLVLSNIAYCSINYHVYKEYTVTDRSGTYYKEVLHDLLSIEENPIPNVWITKESVYKALAVSLTLQSVKPYIDTMYESSWALKDIGTSHKELLGDMFFWMFREVFEEAGYYSNDGAQINQIYKQIHQELSHAFETGQLKKNNYFYISSVGKGISKNDWSYFPKTTLHSMKMLATYSQNKTGVYEAKGDYSKIVLMSHLTNSQFVWPNVALPEEDPMMKSFYRYTNLANKIVSGYQKTGILLLILGAIGILLFSIQVCWGCFHHQFEKLEVWLIVMGMIASGIALLFGVMWFCSWFGVEIDKHVYNYTGGLIPIIQIVELIGGYYLVIGTKEWIQKIYQKRKLSN